MIRFLPVVVIGSRSLAYQGAVDAASQAREGLSLRPLAFLLPLPWNDLVESPFRLGRVAWRYTPRIRQCVGRSRLGACVQVLSPPFCPILLGFALHRCTPPRNQIRQSFRCSVPNAARLPSTHKVVTDVEQD